MSYRAEMAVVATRLGLLVADRPPVPSTDLDVAVGGYGATLSLLKQVYADLTGQWLRTRVMTVPELAQRPVWVFGQLLLSESAPVRGGRLDTLTGECASQAGQAWRELARAATLAQYYWQEADPSSKPRGHAEWSEIADLAALSEGLTLAASDLAESLRIAERHEEASAVGHGATSGLQLVSGVVRQLADSGPLPFLEELAQRPPARLLVVREFADLPEAFQRLSRHLEAVRSINPIDVELIAKATALGALVAAETLIHSPGTRRIAELLGEHAAALGQAGGTSARLAVLLPGDPLPLEQAQSINLYLAQTARRGLRPTEGEAHAFAVALTTVVPALASAARKQLDGRRWLVPSEGGDYDWGRFSPGDATPRLVGTLEAAVWGAHDLHSHLTVGPQPAPGRSAPPRSILPSNWLATARGQRGRSPAVPSADLPVSRRPGSGARGLGG